LLKEGQGGRHMADTWQTHGRQTDTWQTHSRQTDTRQTHGRHMAGKQDRQQYQHRIMHAGMRTEYTGADAPSRGRALASAGVAGNHWGSLVQ